MWLDACSIGHSNAKEIAAELCLVRRDGQIEIPLGLDAPLNEGDYWKPFRLDGPSMISFSGGRTSGFLLWKIVLAHGGRLPDDVHVVFANTGREMPATLDFVRDIALALGIEIVWLEYALDGDDSRGNATPTYRRVTYETASRDGRPFSDYLDHVERMTAAKGKSPYLPSPGSRYCTTELKVRVMKKFMIDCGYEHWTNVVGIRFDEPKRWRKMNRTPPERWEIALPLVDAAIGVADVRTWWSQQPFDLGIKGDWEGNCDGCMLKMPWKVAQVFQDYPERSEWWTSRELRSGKRFRRDHSYADLVQISKGKIERESDEYEIQCTGCTD